ncbi:MAG: hypothetical protein AAGF30_08290 [Pseudomonadota bacterium]
MTNRTVYAAILTAALLALGVSQPVLAATPSAFDTQIVETVQDQELANFKFKKYKHKKFGSKKFAKKKFFYGY